MSFKKTFIGFTLVGLFALAMINFGLLLSENNVSSSSLKDNNEMSNMTQSLNSSLSTFGRSVQVQKNAFENEVVSKGFGTLVIFAIMGAGKVFSSMIIGVFNIVLSPLLTIIGVNPVVLGIFGAILSFTMILTLWRLYKTGD